MEDNSKFDELLISYLSNELNAEDEEFVIQWIKHSEQNRLYFERFQYLWKVLGVKKNIDKIDVDKEWQDFRQMVDHGEKDKQLQQDESSFSDPAESEEAGRKSVLFRIVLTTAVAASVLLIISFAGGLFDSKEPIQPVIASTVEKKTEVAKKLNYEVNSTGKSKRLTLSDGSQVILHSNSEISYAENFEANRREVTIKGKVYFEVAKDRAKPFTVYSGDISTTVLGTKFTVTAFANAANITVRLFEGKVVVKPVANLEKKRMKDFYLAPGQELIYNNSSFTAMVRGFSGRNRNERNANIASTTTEDDIPLVPLHEKGTWYMFNNQPLNQVFQQLQTLYDVEIIYNNKDVANRYFIGKFEKNDSVEVVLKQIAAVNNLRLSKKNNRFILRK